MGSSSEVFLSGFSPLSPSARNFVHVGNTSSYVVSKATGNDSGDLPSEPETGQREAIKDLGNWPQRFFVVLLYKEYHHVRDIGNSRSLNHKSEDARKLFDMLRQRQESIYIVHC